MVPVLEQLSSARDSIVTMDVSLELSRADSAVPVARKKVSEEVSAVFLHAVGDTDFFEQFSLLI